MRILMSRHMPDAAVVAGWSDRSVADHGWSRKAAEPLANARDLLRKADWISSNHRGYPRDSNRD